MQVRTLWLPSGPGRPTGHPHLRELVDESGVELVRQKRRIPFIGSIGAEEPVALPGRIRGFFPESGYIRMKLPKEVGVILDDACDEVVRGQAEGGGWVRCRPETQPMRPS